MKLNGNAASDSSVPALERGRRSPMPIVVVAVLFVLAAFLTWYGTWFGQSLNDEQFAKYLSDKNNPSHVQHALAQAEERIEKRDPGARQWYSQIADLRHSPVTEIRKTAAWVMGNDNSSEEFHSALRDLTHDGEPTVRWNAAVQLARFNDNTGRPELIALLKPYPVTSPAEGVITSEIQAGNTVRQDTLLGRIVLDDDQTEELRSPVSGKIEHVSAAEGSRVEAGSRLFSIAPDEAFVYEALRALVIVGDRDDLADLQSYANGAHGVSNRIRQQAVLTIGAIQSRSSAGR